jgi:hypothetical protein
VTAKMAASHPTSGNAGIAAGRVPSPARADSRQVDPLIRALARYVEALDQRYPDGPEQLRREGLDGRATMRPMRIVGRDPAA